MDCDAVEIEDPQNGRQYTGTQIVLPQIPLVHNNYCSNVFVIL